MKFQAVKNENDADVSAVARALKTLEKARTAERNAAAYVLALEFAKHAKYMYVYNQYQRVWEELRACDF